MNKHTILTEQLIRFRHERDYTQTDVADKLNITRAAYTNYETGIRLPDIFILDQLAILYNVSMEAFLYPPKLYNKFKELHSLPYDRGLAPDIGLDEDEKLLIYHYRQLSARDQKELLHLAEYKSEH